ncbi:hypothetical protein FT663_00142 [Candidozyma haemuli var. vulneris]|uniref:Dihydrofolate reductase n=1 Tax=Candidozyma haemuli TaxID=45357 RepID=A0A2V1ALS1_9ASCO|nr:hypothetical protein CXQ85_001067 [[Candida] haemuloni]KAF3994172.1 hypothetical protein FT662_00041 [[Candida] haemuloni var. vulneris]KAF3995720.1 hypothetical protein FT663_00142 [[Candida] haemuloni var. vulneris]PVH18778.1 hypothetical protein CXQ85_001067 [[Candida] haemuloni]
MSARPKISLIVAALQPSMGIGAKGKLPWRLRQEMKYFKDVTTKAKEGYVNAVIMGRKTWDSIPQKFRPLPGRVNVILSRSNKNETDSDGVLHYNSFDSVMSQFEADAYRVGEKRLDKIFIIGGSQVYNSLVLDPRVDNLLVTHINYVGEESEKPEMDTFLDWDLSKWKQAEHKSLAEFVDIEVPQVPITEGSYSYNYTMWEKLH